MQRQNKYTNTMPRRRTICDWPKQRHIYDPQKKNNLGLAKANIGLRSPEEQFILKANIHLQSPGEEQFMIGQSKYRSKIPRRTIYFKSKYTSTIPRRKTIHDWPRQIYVYNPQKKNNWSNGWTMENLF